MGNLDLRTEKQRERDKMHDRMVKSFLANQKSNEGVKPWTIFKAVGNNFGVSAVCVSKVCEKAGVWQRGSK